MQILITGRTDRIKPLPETLRHERGRPRRLAERQKCMHIPA